MITLASDCLVFRLASGESIPFSADMISVEIMGDTAQTFDVNFVRHAAKAVFHYFKYELARQTVTVGEFSEALEKVLRGFQPSTPESAEPATPKADSNVLESDLYRLAGETADGCELFFFPRLRDELRQQLQQSPRVLRFHSLRPCVKRLMGVRRWSLRCQGLEDQIVAYLRECLGAEPRLAGLSLVVE